MDEAAFIASSISPASRYPFSLSNMHIHLQSNLLVILVLQNIYYIQFLIIVFVIVEFGLVFPIHFVHGDQSHELKHMQKQKSPPAPKVFF